ncbi:histidine phosphatase family protein [Marinobacter sp. X15-166B]|uniref:histidine phosphatase family protein n=1 Tax=Marinobacter sp. X15-166B TaxID=1897620 RepID=UPI00085C5AF3|nr:alpha-ribazole phosphatase family protein [Marinobacter sp. X15-166B]OEY66234.1 phosphoglycerate kinase [Marinobacter sp. X15-166B]
MDNEATTTRIDVLRHGEPEGGPMFRGSQDDPLSELGWQQMREAISPQDRWDAVITSPMLRCAPFAQYYANQQQLPLYSDDRLREISFGRWEGQTAATIMATEHEALSRFWRDPEQYPPPEGEPVTAFYQRVQQAWQHWTTELAGQRLLMVCHGGVIRMILAEVLGAPLGRAFSAIAVPYACRSQIQIERSAYGVMSCLNDHNPSRL